MASWTQLIKEIEAQPADARGAWLQGQLQTSFARIGTLRGRNVLVYASAFLQKPQVSPHLLSISLEDLNGFMATMHGMDWSKGLTLVLHTPGGSPSAAETLVSYLWSKFASIEVIVPAYAMSAGTMISLASNEIIMGRQSQLGPIDPQLGLGGRFASAQAIVDQFQVARSEILAHPAAAHVWAPILTHLGPSLLIDATNALEYGERMVAQWLEKRMFAGKPNAAAMAKATARHFNDAGLHKNHGRRIDRLEARSHNLNVTDLETSQDLQDAVLTAYHLFSIAFERSPMTKLFGSSTQIVIRNAA